jgi:hypothetical protein
MIQIVIEKISPLPESVENASFTKTHVVTL